MNCSREWKPVVIMLAVSFALAVVNLFLKKVLDEGMNQLIIVTYRQSIAAIFLAPIAYFWERKSRPELTARILFQFFLSALIGVTFTQYFFLLGLQYTSATFACAFLNMVPINTFLLALPFGLEKVNLKSKGGRAKVLGTLVCVSGALLLTLYKGMPLSKTHSQASTHITNHGMLIPATRERWAIGSIFLVAGSLMWSSWFLIQARIGKRYSCQYSSTAILNFFGAIQSCILSLIIKRNLAMWFLKGSLEILSVVYAGMVGSGLCYVAMSWCLKQRGPVFTSAFTPFIQIFVAIFDFSVLHEQMYLGSILGSILVISGMYVLLWGKSSEGAECAKQGQVAEEDPKCNPMLPVTNQPKGVVDQL
ncbi:WAT1-related protein At3g30340-like isoform X1 [Quercus robur]|uniref:WAT1-related protein At3g30340-like isoform X1 n=1 Tax=Quercus robur TaxID=38942 RepID=UPI0021621259|nr:WAT1-related protein At3g30340-like isoform X1 [Quercus robur]